MQRCPKAKKLKNGWSDGRFPQKNIASLKPQEVKWKMVCDPIYLGNVTPLLEIQLEANKPNQCYNSVSWMFLTKTPFKCFYYYLRGIPGNSWMTGEVLSQSSWIASLTTRLLSSVDSSLKLHIWQQGEWFCYQHQNNWAGHTAPLFLHRGGLRAGAGPGQRSHSGNQSGSISSKTVSQGPIVVLCRSHSHFSLDIFQSRWYPHLPQSPWNLN